MYNSLKFKSSTAIIGQQEQSVDNIFTTITNIFELMTGGDMISCQGRQQMSKTLYMYVTCCVDLNFKDCVHCNTGSGSNNMEVQ